MICLCGFQRTVRGAMILGGNCEACPSEASARELAGRLAQTHVGVIAWSRTGDPDLGDWGPPEVLVWTGVIPDEFEAGGGVE